MNELSKDSATLLEVGEESVGQRIDNFLLRQAKGVPKSHVYRILRSGEVRVNKGPISADYRLRQGDRVRIPPIRVAEKADAAPVPARDFPLAYEDDALIVIDKPAGLVVHPGAGNPEGTLLNALLHHAPSLKKLARAGIVHRLDKETSGLLVVAKTEPARLHLIQQLKDRSLTREYLALVQGVVVAGGKVDAPIGRHAQTRTRMAVNTRGKPAVSHYRLEKKFRAHTLLRVKLESGRTHQIRVHMAHLKHPLVGDPVYGGRLHMPKGASMALVDSLRGFKRQALHAKELSFEHPRTGKIVNFSSDLPDDFASVLVALRAPVLVKKATEKARASRSIKR